MNDRCKNTYLTNIKHTDNMRLFCFPYAGGGASVFRKWQNDFDGIEVYPVQYPGRENRIMENSISDMNVLVSNIYDELKEIIEECPFMMFGHSLGTKVVYELAIKIHKEKKIWPKGIIVSAGKAPDLKEENPISHLEDEQFIKELVRRYSSIPPEIAANKELMNVFLPMLRADFIMDEKYTNTKKYKLGCPVMGLMGIYDPEMTLDELNRWKEFTEGKFYYKCIKGKHMFINDNRSEVVDLIKDFTSSL